MNLKILKLFFLNLFLSLSKFSEGLKEINLDVNQNDETLMELYPDSISPADLITTLKTTQSTTPKTISFESKRAAVQIPTVQMRTLIGDENQTAEVKQIRKQFIKEALSDPKFTKMREHLEAIKNGTTERSHLAAPLSEEVKKTLEYLNSIDRSKDENVVKSPPTITTLNEHIKDLLFGGDTLKTNEQMDILSASKNENFESRRKRQVQLPMGFRGRNKWNPDIAISFTFDASIDEPTRVLIRLSASFWNYHTCITLLENGNTRPIIRFFKGQGCYSEVGRSTASFKQDISIGQGCEIFGTVTHEIGHALGFFHHQARTDRDQSLDILYQNIEKGWKSQYDKEYNTDNEGIPFDYGSIMLYTGYRPHSDVVEMMAKDKKYMHTMGNNWGPIFYDLLAINKYYHCASRCSTPVDCKNEGFQDSRNCSACICPNGFGGADCSERAKGEGDANEDCGQTVQAEKEFKYLNGSVDPIMLEAHNISLRSAGCHFHIQAPPFERIEVQFVVLSGTCTNDCYFGALEVKYDDFKKGGLRLCCDSHKEEIGKIISRTNLTILSLYSQRDVRYFEIRYKIYNNETTTTAKPTEAPTPNPRAIDDVIGPVASQVATTTSFSNLTNTTAATTPASGCVNLSGDLCSGWLISVHCHWKRHTREQCRKFCGLC